ncbi:MAG: hypothetical protein ABJJ37_08330 [Roseibium sp.]
MFNENIVETVQQSDNKTGVSVGEVLMSGDSQGLDPFAAQMISAQSAVCSAPGQSYFQQNCAENTKKVACLMNWKCRPFFAPCNQLQLQQFCILPRLPQRFSYENSLNYVSIPYKVARHFITSILAMLSTYYHQALSPELRSTPITDCSYN